jgi:hypothetical protein
MTGCNVCSSVMRRWLAQLTIIVLLQAQLLQVAVGHQQGYFSVSRLRGEGAHCLPHVGDGATWQPQEHVHWPHKLVHAHSTGSSVRTLMHTTFHHRSMLP